MLQSFKVLWVIPGSHAHTCLFVLSVSPLPDTPNISVEVFLTSYTSHYNSTFCFSFCPQVLILSFVVLLPCKETPVSKSHCRKIVERKPKSTLGNAPTSCCWVWCTDTKDKNPLKAQRGNIPMQMSLRDFAWQKHKKTRDFDTIVTHVNRVLHSSIHI